MLRNACIGLIVLIAAGLTVCGAVSAGGRRSGPRPPNIILIYADDVGYGDLGCYGARGIPTPNLDRLAREGLRFTQGYSPAATCTPSRYALLTGEYAFRKPGTGVLPGDAALVLDSNRPLLPALLQRAGYRTGVVGKWHLGLGTTRGQTDWNGEIRPGPREAGFDSSFIMAATGDRVPCVYIRDRRVEGLDPRDPIRVSYGAPIPGEPTGKDNPELLKVHPSHGHNQAIVNGISRIGYMAGGKAALWKDEDMADRFNREAVTFVEGAARNRERPFFLYFALHDIHVPRVPHPRFVGQTALGPRGDAMVEADWSVGEVLKVLDRLRLTRDTLVLFTSDNGPVVDDGYRDDAVAKLGEHRPAGPLRGGKYSAFEGGTRVPFLARWPARIRPGVSHAVVSQVDFLASFAALTGQALGKGDGPDSQNALSVLLGESQQGRAVLVQQAGVLTYRAGRWKYIEPGRGPRRNMNTNTETGQAPTGQLYDLEADPGETRDLAAEQPDRVREMAAALAAVRAERRGP